MKTDNDHNGHPVPNNETDDTPILVWVITPGGEGFDEVWIRDWSRAVAYAQDRILMTADGMEVDDLKNTGATVNMKLRRTTVGEYMEVISAES